MYEVIETLCNERNISITNLCKQVTGSSGNLTTWKKGYMRSDYLKKVAEILGVSTDFLLGGMPEEHTEPKDEDFKIRDVLFLPETLHDKFLIQGSPGVGKSQMAASLTQFNDNAIYIENSHVVKAYKMLTEKEKLEVQIYILEKAAASEKSNAKVEVIERTE